MKFLHCRSDHSEGGRGPTRGRLDGIYPLVECVHKFPVCRGILPDTVDGTSATGEVDDTLYDVVEPTDEGDGDS